MSKILISGCGITFPGERPTWLKILRLCKLDITDLSGPAISNYLILNQLLEELPKNNYTHCICQLTNFGKLDVELTQKNRFLMEQDSLRNFEYKGFWPSSKSRDHTYKRIWEDYLYSPKLERQDTMLKVEHLQMLCESLNVKLYVIQGYDIGLSNYNIYDEYMKDATWKLHEHGQTVPCVAFQIKIAERVNNEFLKMDLPFDKFKR